MQKVQIIQMALKQLEPSPRPVRMSWSEEAMEELTQSIKEQGVVVPIKVRPLGDPAAPGVHKWEIIYGHRRVEASRRADLRYINVIIEDMDDPTALIQALTENLQREDLSNYDEGLVYIRLRDECGLKQREVAQLVGKAENWVSRCILLVGDEVAKKLHLNAVPGAASKAQIIRGVLGNDLEARRLMVDKIIDEQLSDKDTRVEAHILKTQGTEEEIAAKAQRYIEQEKEGRERSRWEYLGDSPCAKNFIRRIKVNQHDWKRAWQDIERGALGIEHMPYIEERLRKHAEFIIDLANDLKKRRREGVGE